MCVLACVGAFHTALVCTSINPRAGTGIIASLWMQKHEWNAGKLWETGSETLPLSRIWKHQYGVNMSLNKSRKFLRSTQCDFVKTVTGLIMLVVSFAAGIVCFIIIFRAVNGGSSGNTVVRGGGA